MLPRRDLPHRRGTASRARASWWAPVVLLFTPFGNAGLAARRQNERRARDRMFGFGFDNEEKINKTRGDCRGRQRDFSHHLLDRKIEPLRRFLSGRRAGRIHERASMGPRRDGRGVAGKIAERQRNRSFNGAAARWPRSVDLAGETPGARCLASMGPRRDGRGEQIAAWWSLALRSFNGAAARWPRSGRRSTRQSAERRRFNGAAARWPRSVGKRGFHNRACRASMGPRRDGRGVAAPGRG